jgi:hypothetical protein
MAVFNDDPLRRLHVHVTERQYRLIVEESVRTGLSMATLVRRAIDSTYRPAQRHRLKGYVLSFGVWREPDAAFVGRPKAQPRVRD